ncbi:MAG TPA: ATP-binding protein [Candidatus Limnocylindrales bacterium]|nr:ATP-binding protein [Candidatus Limnocylindrales bacterium]
MDAPDRSAESLARAARSEASSRLIIEIAAAASGELSLDQILHAALDRLRTVIRLTGGSIALVDGDQLIVRAAIGPFAEEALGQRLGRGPSRSWGVVDRLEPYLTGDLFREGDRIVGKAASDAVRSWLAVPIIRHGAGIGLVEVDSTEIDAFGAGDLELLEVVVRVLAGPVELAAHHAEEQRVGALREAFIGVISHELRTPITTIYGLARVLRQRADTIPRETLHQSIRDIEEESDRLYRLVEDLLVLSRAEGGRVEIDVEPVNLGRLVRRIVDGEAQRRPERALVIEVDDGLPLTEAEPTYVEQVVRNLIANAAKYSQPPAPIEVAVGLDGDAITVRILDRGIGVDEETSQRAFELFYRTRAATRFAAGAGIGLFVCRQLVEAMGGEVWMRPRDGGGTEAGFRLPIVEVEDELIAGD